MELKLEKIGDSQGIIIPTGVLDLFGNPTKFSMHVRDGIICIFAIDDNIPDLDEILNIVMKNHSNPFTAYDKDWAGFSLDDYKQMFKEK